MTKSIKKTNTANAIIERLPFHQNLKNSFSTIDRLMPLWDLWRNQSHATNTNEACSLTHFNSGILYIKCENSIIATQISQQNKTILKHFHKHGYNEIEDISIYLAPKFNKQKTGERLSTTRKRPNNAAINSIKSCQTIIKSDSLNNAISNLLDTLQEKN